jgi:ABC-type transport system involved in multi-copper enzyme maturation permease subunit
MNGFSILLAHNLRRLILESRFFVVVLLFAGLVATATWLRSSDYRLSVAQDQAEAERNQQEIQYTGELNRLYDMAPPHAEPGPLAVFHQGVRLTQRDAGTTESDVSETAFNANPLPHVFPPFDFANVVLLVLGLLVLLTSSLGVASEREAGTLELLLTHGVSPRVLVLAKWLASGMAALLLLFAGMTTALLVANVSGVHLPVASVGEFLLSAVCSVFFLLCLAALGTLISVRSGLRTQSIISAIGLWMLITIVLPSSGAYMAATAAPLKDLGKKQRSIEKILTDDREASLNAGIAKLYARDNRELDIYLRPAGLSATKFRALPDSEADRVVRKLKAEDPAFAAFIKREQGEVIDVIETTWNEYAGRAEKAESDLQASIDAQNNLILMFTATFPATAYRESLSRVFGVSYLDLLHARAIQKQYKHAIVEYVFGKARLIGGTDPFNQRVDLSDRPQFQFMPVGAAQRWRTASPFLLVMAAWTALGLVLAVKLAASRS